MKKLIIATAFLAGFAGQSHAADWRGTVFVPQDYTQQRRAFQEYIADRNGTSERAELRKMNRNLEAMANERENVVIYGDDD